MLHLLQFSNQEPSETMQIINKSVVENLEDVKEYPKGVIPFDKNKPSLFPLLHSKVKKAALSKIEKGQTIILTDWTSLRLFSSSNASQYNIIQLLPDLVPPLFRSPLSKTYKKFSEKVKFIAASELIKKSTEDMVDAQVNISVIYPPYLSPADPIKKQGHQSFIIGVVSDLEENLGIETVIQAMNRTREILPQLTMIIVGDGPERKRLNWLVDRLHLRKRVQFVSTRAKYERFLPNFDVVVVPDVFPRGFNPVIIHSFANGIPILASKTGINKELIEHGQSGLLFEPGNSHMLSQHLINLYNHPDWMEHYQTKGPQLVRDQFQIEKFKRTFLDVIA